MIYVLHGDEARFDRIAPAGFRILAALDQATTALGTNLHLTCGTEGHLANDPHTSGEAYDVRIRPLSVKLTVNLLIFLENRLGKAFTILLETPVTFTDPALSARQTINPHATGPHLHIQRRQHTIFPPRETV